MYSSPAAAIRPSSDVRRLWPQRQQWPISGPRRVETRPTKTVAAGEACQVGLADHLCVGADPCPGDRRHRRGVNGRRGRPAVVAATAPRHRSDTTMPTPARPTRRTLSGFFYRMNMPGKSLYSPPPGIDQIALNSGLLTCCASAAEMNFSV